LCPNYKRNIGEGSTLVKIIKALIWYHPNEHVTSDENVGRMPNSISLSIFPSNEDFSVK
jgi:hypothetical protein